MIYTSYFAKIRQLPDNIVPVAICAKPPEGYTGFHYSKLAPDYCSFMSWKKNHDDTIFAQQYINNTLAKLNPEQTYIELLKLCNLPSNKDICLVCFEKSDSFCHRHLVASWLRGAGYIVEEWK